MDNFFSKIWNYIAHGESLPLRILMFRLLSISVAFLCLFIVIPSNMLQDVSPYLNPVVAVYAVLILCIYRVSIVGTHLIKTMFYLTMLLLNICWFLNGGSTGSIGFFYLSTLLFPLILFKTTQRAVMLLLIILNYTALIFIEMHFPSLVTPFAARHDRYFDLLTGFAVSVVLNATLFWVIVTIYDNKLKEFEKSEEKLLESEEKYRVLFEISDDAIFVHDENRILAVNPAACRRLGYSQAELLSLTVIDVDSPEESIQVPERISALIKYGHTIFETVHLRKDGSHIPTEVNASTISWMGQPAIMSTCRDITERKKYELELNQHRINLEKLVDERAAELRRSENRFRSFVENANDVVFTLTPDGCFSYISPNWKKAFGYDLAETVGKPFPVFVHPDDIPVCFNFLQHVLSTGNGENECEYRVLLTNGKYVWYSASGSILHDSDTNQVLFLGIGRDISERKKAEEEKLELERQLLQAQKLESLGVMAGGIAHDFNNLLQSILGNIELASKRLAPDSEPQVYIANAIIAGKHAAHLTSLMLTYAGSGFIAKKELNLNDLVKENVDILKSAVTTAVSIELHLSSELPVIVADEAQIQQVVMNLITNAAESIDKQPGFISLVTGIKECDKAFLSASLIDEKPEPGRYVLLEVADNGCGMSKETIMRLFDPFFTTKFTGRGLGMSAVMGIVKSHFGALFVESEPGKCSKFRIFFPASGSVSSGETKVFSAPPAEMNPSAGNLFSGLALVVDDEKSVRRTSTNMVKLCGLTVINATDGIDAIARFREHADEIVVVLMDLTMPNMDGITAMNEIYGIRPDAKIILSSGFNEDELRPRITGNLPSGFIRKPYSMSTLENELRRVMKAE